MISVFFLLHYQSRWKRMRLFTLKYIPVRIRVKPERWFFIIFSKYDGIYLILGMEIIYPIFGLA